MMHISISITKQELVLSHSKREVMRCPISSGKAGIGFEEGSGKTPTGQFRIYSKHGENAPLHSILRARIPCGIWPRDMREGEQDSILCRVLRLEGLDQDNANTLQRLIYIHGSSDIEHLGEPASFGCIRLKPLDIAELYAHCPIGCPCNIQA